MALLGLSLILASVVLICLRPPAWLSAFFSTTSQTAPRLLPPAPPPPLSPIEEGSEEDDRPGGLPTNGVDASTITALDKKRQADRIAAPPVILRDAKTVRFGQSPSLDSAAVAVFDDEQVTPKASAAVLDDSVPLLTLSVPEPKPASASRNTSLGGGMAPPARPAAGLGSGFMPPPPRPTPAARARAAGSSTLPLPGAQPNRSLPIPNRGPGGGGGGGGGGGLMPPPSHSSKPEKPSKAVALAPGHSPLDWARLSGGPGADLRGLPSDTPYLRVTPSMLRYYTGRKGKDAWTVLGGKVYNITPYMPFHPGGEPELLRVAGRDGTKLFAEIHSWVNYEGMLAACLVGIFVTEEEATGSTSRPGVAGNRMEDMD